MVLTREKVKLSPTYREEYKLICAKVEVKLKLKYEQLWKKVKDEEMNANSDITESNLKKLAIIKT